LLSLGASGRDVNITEDIKPYIAVYRGSAYPDYFAAIRASELVVTFASDRFHYDTERSTSSVPTAIVNHVPIVMPKSLLMKYECLRNMSMYLHVAQEDDCQSLQTALALNRTQMHELREQTKQCYEIWVKEAQQAIASAIKASAEGKAEGKLVAECVHRS
jgi:hypothetical protein